MRLKDKTAIVTGGAAGIGKAIAAAFVAEGARVAILDLDAGKAEQAAAEIGSEGQAFGIACDVGFSESVNQAFDEAERRLGGLDILISNAGVIGKSTIVEMPEEDWDFLIRNNLKSVFLCTQQAARRMIARGVGGRIIAISSIHAVLSEPYCGHYTAAKSGVEGLCRTLASELAEHKITVNFIRPGATYTNLTSPIYTERVKRALYER
ncbi:MAG: SDR family oxidoreductase, partial [Phycisphaeraceae bacterium]